MLPRRVSVFGVGLVVACGSACSRTSLDLATPPLDASPDVGAVVCPDADGDGFQSQGCGGSDCNDRDPDIHVGAQDGDPLSEWRYLLLDDRSRVGACIASAGPGGVVHLLYSDILSLNPPDQSIVLRYGRLDGRGFATEPVADDRVAMDRLGGSMVVAGDDVHVVYGQTAGWHLASIVYLRRSLGWRSEVVAADHDFALPAVALDEPGHAHVAFDEKVEGLRALLWYATNASGTWSRELIDEDSSSAARPAIAVGAGFVAVASYARGDLHVALLGQDGWVVEVVDVAEDTGYAPAVVIDDQARVHVAFGLRTRGDERYALRTPDGWTVETVSENGQLGNQSSIALGASGEPWIAFDEASGPSIGVSRRADDHWEPELELRRAGYGPSLALEASGRPVVAFIGGNDGGPLWLALKGRDGVDQNCDGVDGVDRDGDGHASLTTGGDDPDDSNPDL